MRGGAGQPRHLRARGASRHVRATSTRSGRRWRSCLDLPIVGDVRGDGYLYAIELVKDKNTKETFSKAEGGRLLAALSGRLFEAGLYCRADNRGDPVVQLAPPLISGQKEFDAMYTILPHLCSTRPAVHCDQLTVVTVMVRSHVSIA